MLRLSAPSARSYLRCRHCATRFRARPRSGCVRIYWFFCGQPLPPSSRLRCLSRPGLATALARDVRCSNLMLYSHDNRKFATFTWQRVFSNGAREREHGREGKVNACRFPAEAGGRCRSGSTRRQTIVDRGEQRRAFGSTVCRKPPPIAVIPHIGKNADAVFVKMQKSLAADVKNARSLLDQSRPPPEALQYLTERLQRASASVLHTSLH